MTGVRHVRKLDLRYRDHSNLFCQMISHLRLCIVLLSLCLDIFDTVAVGLLIFSLVVDSLSDVFFFLFFVVLPVVVNKDKYINLDNDPSSNSPFSSSSSSSSRTSRSLGSDRSRKMTDYVPHGTFTTILPQYTHSRRTTRRFIIDIAIISIRRRITNGNWSLNTRKDWSLMRRPNRSSEISGKCRWLMVIHYNDIHVSLHGVQSWAIL